MKLTIEVGRELFPNHERLYNRKLTDEEYRRDCDEYCHDCENRYKDYSKRAIVCHLFGIIDANMEEPKRHPKCTEGERDAK